jgi:hypothetical protein
MTCPACTDKERPMSKKDEIARALDLAIFAVDEDNGA